MLATLLLLILLNIVVWVFEQRAPYHNPAARVSRSGRLLLLYLPLWAILYNIVLILSYLLFVKHRNLQHGNSMNVTIFLSLWLALTFALLHRPFLSLLGRYILRAKPGLWALASAGFGVVAGAILYLIVGTRASLSPVQASHLASVLCITSGVTGYCVGYVRSTRPRQAAI